MRGVKGSRRHGTESGYRTPCRCARCKEAHARRNRDQARRRAIKGELNPSLIPHGTASGYLNWACRCDACRGAATAAKAALKARGQAGGVR